MTTVPLDIHRNPPKEKLPVIPESWTLRDTLVFTVVGVTLFTALFAFMFALGNM